MNIAFDQVLQQQLMDFDVFTAPYRIYIFHI